MYRRAKLSIDGMDGIITVNGWAQEDNYWNGWSYVLMNKDNAKRLADKLKDVITYDKSKDEFVEIFDSNQHESEDDLLHWSGVYNEELGEKVYSIGSGYWCWNHTLDAPDLDFRNRLQSIYGDMLRVRGIKHGDIDPTTSLEMEEAEDKLAEVVKKWIRGLEG